MHPRAPTQADYGNGTVDGVVPVTGGTGEQEQGWGQARVSACQRPGCGELCFLPQSTRTKRAEYMDSKSLRAFVRLCTRTDETAIANVRATDQRDR